MKKIMNTAAARTLLVLLLALLGARGAQAEEYACVLTSDPTTLHFYNDDRRAQRSGYTCGLEENFDEKGGPGWAWQGEHAKNVTTVVFEDEIKPTSTAQWFKFFEKLTTIKKFYNLKTENVTDMSLMFYGCKSLKKLDFNAWYTDTPEDNCTNNQCFVARKVTNMTHMFRQCTGLTSVDLTGMMIREVRDFSYMFAECTSLKTLYLCEDGYNDDKIGTLYPWTLGYVGKLDYMFYNCSSLKTIYAGLNLVDKLKTNAVYQYTSTNMFLGCTSLVGGDGYTYDSSHTDAEYPNYRYFTSEPFTPYAILSSDGATLTFYTDNSRYSRVKNDGGTAYPIHPLTTSAVGPGWSSQAKAANITKVVFDASFADARPTSTAYWFNGMSNLKTENIVGLENLNTSSVTTMSHMFYGCSSLTYLYLNTFNTAKVTDMSNMFTLCSSLEHVDLVSFQTNRVTTMYGMFSNCSKLKVLDLSSFDPGSLTYAQQMFFACGQLETIHVSSSWALGSNVRTNSDNMFTGCTNLVGGNGTAYAPSNPKDATYAVIDKAGTSGYFTSAAPYAVYNNGTLTFYHDGKHLTRAGKVYSIYRNPIEDHAIKTGIHADGNVLNVTKAVFDSSFKNARPTGSFMWFYLMTNLEGITNLQYLNTSQLTSMEAMFTGCSKLTSLNLSGFDTQNVTSFSWTFSQCSSLKTLDLSSFSNKSLTEMIAMFYGCSNLETIYVSDLWEWSDALKTKGGSMFQDCDKLTGSAGSTLGSGVSASEHGSYAHIDGGTSNRGLFSYAPYAVYSDGTLTFYSDGKQSAKAGKVYALPTTATLPGWNTQAVNVNKVVFTEAFKDTRPTSTYGWFMNMKNLTEITGLEYLNTSEVTSMKYMFSGCTGLTTLDLSKFDTQKVTDMTNMFKNCSSLTTIYSSGAFTTASVTNSSDMFTGCTSIVGSNGTTYDASHVDKEYARVGKGYTPGYFSNKPYVEYVASEGKLFFYNDGESHLKQGQILEIASSGTPAWYYFASNIKQVMFDGSFATARPTSTRSWFSGMSNLTSDNILDMKYLNTSEVTDMAYMFNKCSKLETLNLMNFDTQKVTNANYMFSGCSLLTTIYASNWNLENATSTGMFASCAKLVGGNGTTYNASNISGTYARIDLSGTPGYFTVKPYVIWDSDAQTLTFYNDGQPDDKTGIRFDLNSGDEERPGWTDGTYSANRKVKEVIFDPSFATARPTTTYFWFGEMGNYMTKITGIEYLNTSEVTNMGYMFYNDSKLTDLDLSHFNTEKVTDMRRMFQNCYGLVTIDLTAFDTKNVTEMNSMFSGNRLKLTTILVSAKWNTDNVTSSNDMFYNCSNKLVGGAGTAWNSSNPTDKTYAIIDGTNGKPGYLTNGTKETYAVWDADTKTLTHYYDHLKSTRTGTILDGQGYDSGDEQDWNQAGVYFKDILKVVYDPSLAKYPYKNINGGWYCGGMSNLTTIEGLQYIDTSNATTFQSLFTNCSSLTSLDLSTFDTRKAKYMAFMFYGCTNLQELTLGENWSTENVTEMNGMFAGGCNPAVIDAVTNHEGFTTENVTTMSSMFSGNTGISQLDLSMFNTAKVTNMTSMFEGCTALTTIIVGNGWTTDAVTASTKMFTGCTNLVGGNGTKFVSSRVDKTYARIDRPNNAGYLTGATYPPYAHYDEETFTLTFYADGKQDEKLGTTYSLPGEGEEPAWYNTVERNNVMKVVIDESFATARPTSMWRWFCNMGLLSEVEGMENLVTSEVTDMEGLFSGCVSLTMLDLTAFDTQKVTSMYNMFFECQNLETIYVGSGWTTANVSDGSGMFYNCQSLVGSAGTVWEDCFVKGIYDDGKPYAHVDGGEDNPGLLSGKTEAYAVYTSDNTTLTFYYDAQRLVREGTVYDLNEGSTVPAWRVSAIYGNCKTVVFDSSFADARPTSTYSWFLAFSYLKEIQGIENLNTSEVTMMGYMFNTCASLKSVDVSGFDTRNVTNMMGMFQRCAQLTVLDLSNFDTHQVSEMTQMFSNCTNLKTIYVGEGWSTENVTRSGNMFSNTKALVGGNGTAWSSENPLDKTYAIIDGTDGQAGYLTKAQAQPYAAYNAATATLTFYCDKHRASHEASETVYSLNEDVNQPDWYDVNGEVNGKVATVVFDESFADARPTTTYCWFTGMNALTSIEGMEYFNTSAVTNMAWMFENCTQLTSLDLSTWNTENVETVIGMFHNCSSLETIDLSGWNTGKLYNAVQMFAECPALTTIYASGDWGKNAEMEWVLMFEGCTSLVGGMGTAYDAAHINHAYARIDGGEAAPGYFSYKPYAVYDSDNTTLTFYCDGQRKTHTAATETVYDLNKANVLPGWFVDDKRRDVTKVVFDESFVNARPTATTYWFCSMENLTDIEGMEHLNTSAVVDMNWTFNVCTGLTSLDLSTWNTENVVTAQGMFTGCSSLETLDLSGWNTKNLQYAIVMFAECPALKTIYATSDWNTSSLENWGDMFTGCTSLVGGKGTAYDEKYRSELYARIDGGTSKPGYFTQSTKFLLGDVNQDGSITIADVTALVNIILGKATDGSYNLQAADVNQDGSITIADVTSLVNIILGK